MTAYWIDKLNESASRLHKEDVLNQALVAAKLGMTEPQIFLGLTRATYDALITWGVKQVPTTEGIVGAENPWSDYNHMLQLLHRRALTGHAARDAIDTMSKRFDSHEWNTFCAPVLRKDLRAGISEKTVNKVCKGTQWEIPVFSCQLATDCEGRPEMSGVKRIEPKLDGVRVLMVCQIDPDTDAAAVVAYSRNGQVFENFGHIESQLANAMPYLAGRSGHCAFVLDGEITDSSFQSLMRQARRKKNVNLEGAVFNVFDFIPLDDFQRGHWNDQLHKRLRVLNQIKPTIEKLPGVKLLDHIEVDLDTALGRDRFDRYCRDTVDAGFEGVMIKDLDAPYLCKRTTHWLKWKPTITVDVTIKEYEEGTGKNVGKLGAVRGSGVDSGRNFSVYVGGGYSDDERASLWRDRHLLPGRVMEVIADGVTKNQDGTYSLRFPRFGRFRDTLTGDKE